MFSTTEAHNHDEVMNFCILCFISRLSDKSEKMAKRKVKHHKKKIGTSLIIGVLLIFFLSDAIVPELALRMGIREWSNGLLFLVTGALVLGIYYGLIRFFR